MAIVAVGLGWLVGTMPTATLKWSATDLGWGVAATIPMLAAFWICIKTPWRPLENITHALDETLIPMLRQSSLIDLAAISLLAGLGEELLFRGFLQQIVGDWFGGPAGVWVGLAVASLAFGLLHAVTPTYAVLATLIGLYLGWLWIATGNLLSPITAHAVYDFIAVLYFIRVRQSAVQ